MIVEDIAVLFTEEMEHISASKLAHKFDRERKWAYSIRDGCHVILTPEFVCGLHALGYELKLEKINRRN